MGPSEIVQVENITDVELHNLYGSPTDLVSQEGTNSVKIGKKTCIQNSDEETSWKMAI
jgi:hypothetical protein